MVSQQSIDEQLEKIGFKRHGWGLGELNELHNIILPDEEIFECVNGMYEGGFALAVATDVRVLLIDKKPLNFLIVEDLRFDQINEIDYHHRLFGAHFNISTGVKTLKFRSYNQTRLRKLITHVQHCMAEGKKRQDYHQQGQNLHLEQINQQLQAYLAAMHEHQQQLHRHLGVGQGAPAAAPAALPADAAAPLKPSPELSDYLFAQSLLAQYQAQAIQVPTAANQSGVPADDLPPIQVPGLEQLEAARRAVAALTPAPAAAAAPPPAPAQPTLPEEPPAPSVDELYNDGLKEVFGKRPVVAPDAADQTAAPPPADSSVAGKSEEINPLKVAYSKLPLALRHRRNKPKTFKVRRERPSFQVPAVAPAPGVEPV